MIFFHPTINNYFYTRFVLDFMKVVGVSGSPRPKSNSSTIVKAALDEVASKGAETELFEMTGMKFEGCSGCMYCKSKGKCVKNDDVTKIIDAIFNADAVVFAAPIYFHKYNSQFRALIDRFYCLVKPDFSCALPAGKKAIVVSTQGAPDETAFKSETEWLAETLSSYFKFNVVDKLVFVNGNDVNAAAGNQEFISKVKAAADKLI